MNNAEPRVASRPPILAAFAVRDFRLLWAGLLVSNLGTWMQFTALGFYVASLANNAEQGALNIGFIGLARAIPVLLLSPIAGVVADRYPRKTVLLITNGLTALIAFAAFVLIALHHAPLWALMIVSGAAAGTQSFDSPARQSWVPLMVPRALVGGAVGLNSIAFNAPAVVGPPVAGLLIAAIGVAPCFLVNAIATFGVVIALLIMRPAPASDTERGNVIHAILEGVRFLFAHPVLRWVILMLIVTSLTVRPYNFLLPAYAVHVLHTDARGLGWLLASGGIGAIIGAFFTAATGGQKRGAIWLFSAALGGAAIAALGFSTTFIPATIALAFTGFSALSFTGSSNILLQTLAPDDMRGRALSVYSMILLGLVPLGSLAIGAAATVLNLHQTFVAAGAIALLIAIGIGITQPAVRAA